MKSIRPRLQGKRLEAFKNLNKKERRILVIGDLHAPFIQEGYFEFCKYIYNIYNCNQVIFIGDIIDNHYASFHSTDPNGMSGGDELSAAIKVLKPWKETFKKADVIVGNHDRMIMRKAFSSAIPKQWIKSYSILNKVVYTGYPNTLGPLTISGEIAGFSPSQHAYMISYAWQGSSGSGVFDHSGKYIGYVVAIDIGQTEHGIQILQNVVLVVPAFNVDWNKTITESE